MTPPPLCVEPKEESAAATDLRRPVTTDRCTTDGQRAATMSLTAADNVAYFGPTTGDDETDDRRRETTSTAANGGRHSGAPDRHQLPPSTLTPVQFEMSYGTPAAGAADMSSKDNLLTPRGQLFVNRTCIRYV